ncbi:hypothetical protein [Thiosocius teredinicola]|uniref:hypothetical protein n=1 Tax=Thiosocius teredinicola TaxID=1973002 RepID=UPI000F78DCE7
MKKLIKPLAWFLFGTLMAYVGFLATGYIAVYIEANDRMKYEAAYALAYFKVLKQLEEGDTEKAKRMLNWYIDAHFIKLSEYRYLQNSLLIEDIDRYLCPVAQYKLENESSVEVKQSPAKEQILELAREILDEGC